MKRLLLALIIIWSVSLTPTHANIYPLPSVPVHGDFNGDDLEDVGIFVPVTGNWYLMLSGTSGITTVAWGLAGDLPQPADFDGDGKSDVVVYRPSTGEWYIQLSGSPGLYEVRQGPL